MRNKKLIIMFSVLAALVLLVVLSSVVFSVQHIDAYCYNADDVELETQVAASTGLKKGRSIFVINEDKIADLVEQGTGYKVKVINVERKFPNRVSVNYVKITPYAYISDGNSSYVFGNNLRITEITDETPSMLIKVMYSGEHGDQIGAAALSGEQAETLMAVLDSFPQLGYNNDVVDLIGLIDLRFQSSVFIQTRAGCVIELVGKTDIFKKLRLAMTGYVNKDGWKTSGTIIVSGGSASHSEENRYAQALEKL